MPSKNDISRFKIREQKEKNILPQSKSKVPKRKLKGFYLQKDYENKYDQFLLVQKQKTNKKSPDFIEEALDLLFKKYNFKGLDIY